MKNRFNNLTSKQWLPFQKSWFLFNDLNDVLAENILFFTQIREDESYFPTILLKTQSDQINRLQKRSELSGRQIRPFDEHARAAQIDFAVFDLLPAINSMESADSFPALLSQLTQDISAIIGQLIQRKFILVLAKNTLKNGVFYPFAYLIAKHLQTILSLKDEKVGIDLQKGSSAAFNNERGFTSTNNHIYALYFRKDEAAGLNFDKAPAINFKNHAQAQNALTFERPFPSYQIVKPPPRKKNEILHPAKYPEVLIESFIRYFSKPDENIFDPMSGTGSTQLAALQLQRNAYGTELSPFFADIARQRCTLLLSQTDLFKRHANKFQLKTKDARDIKPDEFPPIHYIITSPPYWDMLNMKGAENQAKRRQKGLQTNYSDSEKDLGNVADYEAFLQDLSEIYFKLFELLQPGRYMTVIVKNIKKKGRNYPLAYDLALRLSEKFILCPESFWFQDDLRIAPYGYGNTWVSNTFHHYCLTFQKP